jgi:hypothetical protein
VAEVIKESEKMPSLNSMAAAVANPHPTNNTIAILGMRRALPSSSVVFLRIELQLPETLRQIFDPGKALSRARAQVNRLAAKSWAMSWKNISNNNETKIIVAMGGVQWVKSISIK